jgi:hypothetical protein
MREGMTKEVETQIDAFVEAFPLVDTFVSATELFKWHERLVGHTMRNFPGAQLAMIDWGAEYTILEFFALTRNLHGGEIIKRLEERYRSMGG